MHTHITYTYKWRLTFLVDEGGVVSVLPVPLVVSVLMVCSDTILKTSVAEEEQ